MNQYLLKSASFGFHKNGFSLGSKIKFTPVFQKKKSGTCLACQCWECSTVYLMYNVELNASVNICIAFFIVMYVSVPEGWFLAFFADCKGRANPALWFSDGWVCGQYDGGILQFGFFSFKLTFLCTSHWQRERQTQVLKLRYTHNYSSGVRKTCSVNSFMHLQQQPYADIFRVKLGF